MEEACFKAAPDSQLRPDSRPASPPFTPHPPPHSTLATWMLSTRRLAVQFSRTPPPWARPLRSFLNGGTHSVSHTPLSFPLPQPPRGFLAGAQKCKTMFWLGRTTSRRGIPKHLRRKRKWKKRGRKKKDKKRE